MDSGINTWLAAIVLRILKSRWQSKYFLVVDSDPVILHIYIPIADGLTA